MKTVTVGVKFETSFNFEYEGELTDELIDEEIELIIESLADASNQYWRDADYTIIEEGEPGFRG